MDNSNWRPAQADPNMVDTPDWRTQLQADSRQRIVNKIMDNLKRHLPISGPEGLIELKKIAVRFEEKIYTAATSQTDYLRKISLKMLMMETGSQNTDVANALPQNSFGNQNPADPATQIKGRFSLEDVPSTIGVRVKTEDNAVVQEKHLLSLGASKTKKEKMPDVEITKVVEGRKQDVQGKVEAWENWIEKSSNLLEYVQKEGSQIFKSLEMEVRALDERSSFLELQFKSDKMRNEKAKKQLADELKSVKVERDKLVSKVADMKCGFSKKLHDAQHEIVSLNSKLADSKREIEELNSMLTKTEAKHLAVLEEVKTDAINDVGKTYMMCKIKMMEEIAKGLHRTWNIDETRMMHEKYTKGDVEVNFKATEEQAESQDVGDKGGVPIGGKLNKEYRG